MQTPVASIPQRAAPTASTLPPATAPTPPLAAPPIPPVVPIAVPPATPTAAPPATPIAAPSATPIAAPPATPIAAPLATLIAAPAAPAASATPATPPGPQSSNYNQLLWSREQQPQQLHTHTLPEPAVPSIEQGPRQGPKYSKEVATIAKIYKDNQKACQGVPIKAYNSISVG